MKLADYLSLLVHAQLEGKVPPPVPEGITLEQLDEIASRNHMDYLILGALLRTECLEEEWVRRFRARVAESIMKTAVQVMELKELVKRFEERQIFSQPLKGSCLKFIYPAPEMREMGDIDILIGADCMDKASKVLTEMGYTMTQSIKHHDIYMKKPYMVIEAHRAMYDKTVDKSQYEYFSDLSKLHLEKGYRYTYAFKSEDFYVYMLAHMAKHFYKMGCGIRNLIDIYIFRKKYDAVMDKKYISEELAKCKLTAFAEHMERAAEIWLGEECWEEFYEQLFSYMLDSGLYGKDENGIWNKFAEKKMHGKQATNGMLKLWYFFPPLYYMSEYYPWLEHKPVLLPVAWGIRAFGGVFRKKGTHKREMVEQIDSTKVQEYQNIYQRLKLNFKG